MKGLDQMTSHARAVRTSRSLVAAIALSAGLLGGAQTQPHDQHDRADQDGHHVHQGAGQLREDTHQWRM